MGREVMRTIIVKEQVPNLILVIQATVKGDKVYRVIVEEMEERRHPYEERTNSIQS